MKNIILAIFISILFGACKKENDTVNNTNNTNNSNSDSTQLAVYFEQDTTIASGQDTILKYVYSYLNDKRIKNIKRYIYYSSGPQLSGSMDFLYNGSDSLPYLRIDNPGTYVDSFFLFYDAAGKLAFDSIRHYDPPGSTNGLYLSFRYNHSANSFATTQINYLNGGTYHSNVTYNSGSDMNIQSLHYASSTFGNTDDEQYTYDTHPNPFYIKGCRDYSPSNNDFYTTSFSITSSSKNNITGILDDYQSPSGNTHSAYIRNFSYGLNGYPVKVVQFDNSTGVAGYQFTGIFLYNH